MKLFTTILAGALTVGVGALGGCSEDDPATGGTSGSGGSAGSGGSSGAGSGGAAGKGGTAGGDAGMCVNTNAATIAECKTRGTSSGACAPLVTCSCDKCACLLTECEAMPLCKAIRDCATRTRCCSPQQVGCVGTMCNDASTCAAEIMAGSAGGELAKVLEVSACVYTDNSCPGCQEGGAPSDAATDAPRDTATGG